MIITNEGIIIRIAVNEISVIGRNTSGVILMNIDPSSDVKVASIAKVRDDGDKSEGDGIEELTGEADGEAGGNEEAAADVQDGGNDGDGADVQTIE